MQKTFCFIFSLRRLRSLPQYCLDDHLQFFLCLQFGWSEKLKLETGREDDADALLKFPRWYLNAMIVLEQTLKWNPKSFFNSWILILRFNLHFNCIYSNCKIEFSWKYLHNRNKYLNDFNQDLLKYSFHIDCWVEKTLKYYSWDVFWKQIQDLNWKAIKRIIFVTILSNQKCIGIHLSW